jgi:subtilase family serine protease
VAAGSYAIGVKADLYSVVPESNETNNLLMGNRQFVVAAP